MTNENEAIRTIRSATDETADAVKSAASDAAGATADVAREAAARSADVAKKVTEQSSREFNRLFNDSAQASQDAARQISRNFDVLVKVGTVMASGYQSIVAEWSKYAQQTAKRNTEALNKVLKVRNARDLLDVQDGFLKESVESLLSASARASELSARTANEAAGKLNAGGR